MKNKILFLLYFLVIPFFVQAQNTKSELYKKAQMGIYENPEEAIKIAKELLKNETDPDRIIEINLLLSNAYTAQRNFDESLKYILKAKEALNSNTDEKTRINVLISTAVQYQQMEIFGKSLETLDEAEQFVSQLSDENTRKFSARGKIYAIRGMIYKSQENPEMALEKFLIAEKNLKKAPQSVPNFANLSVIFYNIAYCYENLNQFSNTKTYFLQSVEYAKKAKANSLEAFALKGLGEMYLRNGDHQQSLELLSQAENLSKNVGDLVLNEGIYKGMADNYLALKQIDNYRTFNRKYIEMRFQREQSELKSINRSIDEQTLENNKKTAMIKSKYQKINWIAVAISILIFSILGWFIFKTRTKNQGLRKKIQDIMSEG